MSNRNNLLQAKASSGGSWACSNIFPSRILVVEANSDLCLLYTDALASPKCRVDVAKDGATAWEALKSNNYDLLITENDIPTRIGDELVEKLRDAHMAMPVLTSAGRWPRPEPVPNQSSRFAATLWKPFELDILHNAVKHVLHAFVLIIMLQVLLPVAIQAQEVKAASNSDAPLNAMILSVRGDCDYSKDGVTFVKLKYRHTLEQGAIVRTGEDARADLFFRRTGTTVRLQKGTEIKIEKMTLTMENGLPLERTLLDLRTGRIFAVVRSAVAGSTLEIRNAAERAVVEGSGVGRYIITADGTHVTAEGSVMPLKVIGENGITVVAAGQRFDKKEGKMLPVSPNSWVKELIELDELQAASQQPIAKKSSSNP